MSYKTIHHKKVNKNNIMLRLGIKMNIQNENMNGINKIHNYSTDNNRLSIELFKIASIIYDQTNNTQNELY
jgi:hypothetical protein